MSRPWVFAEEAKGRTRGLFLSDISTKNDCQFEWGGGEEPHNYPPILLNRIIGVCFYFQSPATLSRFLAGMADWALLCS
jgi:hypothetical protein